MRARTNVGCDPFAASFAMESSILSMLVIWMTVNASALGRSSLAQSGEVEDEMGATVETGEALSFKKASTQLQHRYGLRTRRRRR